MQNVVNLLLVSLLSLKVVMTELQTINNEIRNILTSDSNIEELIRNALTGLKSVLRNNGDRSLNISNAEPLLINKTYSYRHSNTNFANISSTLKNPGLYGLSSYSVQNVSANLRKLEATAELNFYALKYYGSYSLDGTCLGGYLPVFGNGYMLLGSNYATATIWLKFSLTDSIIDVQDVSLKLYIPNYWIYASNLLGDSEGGRVGNFLLTDLVQFLKNKYINVLKDFVEDAIFDMLDNYFDDMSLTGLFYILKQLADKAG